MGAAIAFITIGSMLVYSSLHGVGIVDLFKGDTGDPLNPAGGSGSLGGTISDAANAATGAAQSAGAMPAGLTLWHGHKMCKWIAHELDRANAHRPGTVSGADISSAYRSKADQATVCATGVQPCATPGQSNHQGTSFPSCAVDVNYVTGAAPRLAKVLAEINSPLVYAGSKDDVHFSHPHNGSY